MSKSREKELIERPKSRKKELKGQSQIKRNRKAKIK